MPAGNDPAVSQVRATRCNRRRVTRDDGRMRARCRVPTGRPAARVGAS
ncbi:uncharacterized protein BCN122_II3079 [Burkholderia cenocepacia]|nr:uncharacterized protein BCN122_II3079 [Burkholderia cenocepacia]